MIYGGIFDYAEKKDRLSEIDAELSVGEIWVEDPDKAQRFGQEKARLEEIVRPIDASATTLDDSEELLAMAADEDDASKQHHEDRYAIHTQAVADTKHRQPLELVDELEATCAVVVGEEGIDRQKTG